MATLRVDASRANADAATVDALARARLAARSRGFELRLVDPPRDLVDLIEFLGLADVLRPAQQR